MVHGNLGAALEARGDLRGAIAHYRRAIELATGPGEAARNRDNLATALVKAGYQAYTRGDYPASLADLTEAARLEPDNPGTLDRLAVALLAAGRTAEAADRLEAALALRPDDPAIRNRLALALAFSGRLDEAAAHYRQALRSNPTLASGPESVPNLLRARGRGEDAARLERAVASGP